MTGSITSFKKHGVFSVSYFLIFGFNMGKYGPETTPYLDVFPTVKTYAFGKRSNLDTADKTFCFFREWKNINEMDQKLLTSLNTFGLLVFISVHL